eukprot:6490668-Amphidinium_carterae.2
MRKERRQWQRKRWKTVTCYTCGKAIKKPTTHNSQERAMHNSHPINSNTTLNLKYHRIQLPQLNGIPKATTKAMGSNGTKEARKVNKFQCISSTTMTTPTCTTRTHTLGTILGVRNGSQRETTHNNCLDKQQSQVRQQQPSSPKTMRRRSLRDRVTDDSVHSHRPTITSTLEGRLVNHH